MFAPALNGQYPSESGYNNTTCTENGQLVILKVINLLPILPCTCTTKETAMAHGCSAILFLHTVFGADIALVLSC